MVSSSLHPLSPHGPASDTKSRNWSPAYLSPAQLYPVGVFIQPTSKEQVYRASLGVSEDFPIPRSNQTFGSQCLAFQCIVRDQTWTDAAIIFISEDADLGPT